MHGDPVVDAGEHADSRTIGALEVTILDPALDNRPRQSLLPGQRHRARQPGVLGTERDRRIADISAVITPDPKTAPGPGMAT